MENYWESTNLTDDEDKLSTFLDSKVILTEIKGDLFHIEQLAIPYLPL